MDGSEHRAFAGRAADGGGRRGRGGDVLPSRRDALARLTTAIEARAGLVLVSGEHGVGKTWLTGRLQDAAPANWRWITVDLGPAIDPAGFHHLILDPLGLDPARGPAQARTLLADWLDERANDGESWGLVVEECHSASTQVLEEIRILGNAIGRRRGFAAIVMTGQSALLRRLSTRALASLEARTACWVHLRPLEVEELGAWLALNGRDQAWSAADLERLHRDSGGNPRRLLRLLPANLPPAPVPAPPRPTKVEAERLAPPTQPRLVEPARLAEPAPTRPMPPLVPPRPPLIVADDMIEVGWADAEAGETAPVVEAAREEVAAEVEAMDIEVAEAVAATAPVEAVTDTEELIDDHYAALQAWTEWSRNQGREPAAIEASEDDAVDVEAVEPSAEAPLRRGPTSVWAEGQHAFAPYSQLFSRLRLARDSQ